MEQDFNRDEIQHQNYLILREILENGLEKAELSENLHDAKGCLIEIQSHFRGLILRREDREELYGRLQVAFADVNRKIEEEHTSYEHEALANYADLKPAVLQATDLAESSDDMRGAWDILLRTQNQVKSMKLLREHRDELFALLQDAFELIKIRRDEERQSYNLEAQSNYVRLKALVEKGLLQAEETHEYKETREYLKKIQAEFKGIKMNHEQREELYSRLQTAFDILGKRLDDFFRHKKKNWEVKMQYTLSRFSVDIYELERGLEKDEAYLRELEDQLEIIISSGKEVNTRTGIQARISSAQRNIRDKQQKINELKTEQSELQNRLEEPQN